MPRRRRLLPALPQIAPIALTHHARTTYEDDEDL